MTNFYLDFFIFFEAAAKLFDNYLVFFMVYSILTYSAEVLLKFETRTYWYDRLITPYILITYVIHTWLLAFGVDHESIWNGTLNYWDYISNLTQSIHTISFAYIVIFLWFWVIRLIITGVHDKTSSTPKAIIKKRKKFLRVDAAVLLFFTIFLIVQGEIKRVEAEEYFKKKELEEKNYNTKPMAQLMIDLERYNTVTKKD